MKSRTSKLPETSHSLVLDFRAANSGGEKEVRLFPPQNKTLIKTQSTAVRCGRYHPPPLLLPPLSPSSQPGPLSHSYQQGSELPQWKPASLSLRLLGRKCPRSKPSSAVSSELCSLMSLSGTDSVRDQVQSTRGYSKPRCGKANKAPCVVFFFFLVRRIEW